MEARWEPNIFEHPNRQCYVSVVPIPVNDSQEWARLIAQVEAKRRERAGRSTEAEPGST
jgi:hypothetical protein